MGIEIKREVFDHADYAAFSRKLDENLQALAEVTARSGFGEGPRHLGAELEMSLVSTSGRPAPINGWMLEQLRDPCFTAELDRFNLECNTHPTPLQGTPFSALQKELEGALGKARSVAARRAARVAVIGILPTLVLDDFGPGAMTDTPRYRALAAGLRRLRDRPFRIRIDGVDPLCVFADDVTLEGANTSLQIHLQVEPKDFGRTYNAAQVATPITLAGAGNSPTFLAHDLWEETRVALFKQAVDVRRGPSTPENRVARVSYGGKWVEAGALELFSEAVRLHEPLLPICDEEDALACVRSGGVPELRELRLHHGTVWRWNRAVYDASGGGHLRIELRALPSGPTVTDMLANAAFLIGLTLALSDDMPRWTERVDFADIETNFYRAAQHGLDAELVWLDERGSVGRMRASELAPKVLPLAHQGLLAAGVDPSEVERWLSIVAERIDCGATGARWQRARVRALRTSRSIAEAYARMLHEYMDHSESERPVHRWPPA